MTSPRFRLRLRWVSHIVSVFSVLPSLYAQQIGSFNTVIYLNGAALSPSQISCSGMGQPEYCCGSGQSCAWDNAGQLACCAVGMTCTGNAAAAGQYQQSQAVTQTKTVYASKQNDCNCETTTTPNVNVAPAVVVPLTTTTTVQQYSTPSTTTTSPYVYTSTTTTPVAVAATGGNCANGYTTVTEANVGQPTRVVGCYVIIDSGAQSSKNGWYGRMTWLLGLTSVTGLLVAEII